MEDERHVSYMEDVAKARGYTKKEYSLYELGRALSNLEHEMFHRGYRSDVERASKEEINALSDEDWLVLLPYALMLSCLQGNAFPPLIEQYMDDALASLKANGWWDRVRNWKIADDIKREDQYR